MRADWTRWFPALKWARAIIASGELGAVVHVSGDMAFQAMLQRSPHADRFVRADLGGGGDA
jgi:predicted dehydrogenase